MKEARFDIRPARPADADSIVMLFEAAYDDYPDSVYQDPDKLTQVINSSSTTEVFVVEISNGQNILTQTSIIGTGSIRYASDRAVAELSKAALNPAYQGLRHPNTGQSAYQSLLTTRIDCAYESGAKILRTKANSSVHAITQREHHKQGFVPVGVSKGRYREVFAGKGRENIVFMMDTASTYRPVGNSDTVTVYLHPNCVPLVKHVIDSFHEPTGRSLKRTVRTMRPKCSEDWSFSLNTAIDRRKNLSLDCNIYPSSDGIPMEAVIDEIRHLVADSGIEFASVALDANHPSAAMWVSNLTNLGFQVEAFEPDLHRNGDISDRLRLQLPPQGTNRAQFIDPVLELLDRQSISYRLPSDPGPIPVSNVTEVIL